VSVSAATERRQRAADLRAQGLSLRQIGLEMGVTTTTVLRWLDPGYAERSRRLSRASKERNRGTCEDCGAPTNACRGPGKASRRCLRCSARHSGERRRGTGSNQQQLYAFLTEPRRYSEIRDHLNISDGHAGVLLHRELGAGRIVRAGYGLYAIPAGEATA
jgi:hypothetical protein